ncbi:hypothetical protein [Saccharothrix coeruleofusca]|uniref:Type I restriction modification DNA specificity protein n=1 Tax=Saccharothrix coeruleofusca TaxID=33919 RepID=A0A918AJK4_9PSEU|nr:hypothetical protein [Saccharothrix coeruleofusca]GGP45084.1 hypothetical protein GCM10010185_16100 [Saccharothrix coeruleofusca]
MDSLIGPVPNSWEQHPLGLLADITAGPSGVQTALVDDESAEVPVVMPKDLRHNRIACRPASGVPSRIAEELVRYTLRRDDIVCLRTGRLGRQGLVAADQRGWLFGPGCLRVRVRSEVSAAYLVYYLGHPAVRNWVLGNARGAVIPTLSTKMLGSLPVVVPDADLQAEVGDLLMALDDKVVVHEQISTTTAALRDAALLRLLSGDRA